MALLGVVAIGILATIMILGLIVLIIYNGIIRSRLRTEEAWSAIDVQLKRRADLVPNLVESVKGYAIHEQKTLSDVVNARNVLKTAQGVNQAAEADNILTHALGRLFAVVEAYPQLKASENFIALQKDIYDVEEKIAYARQFYNRNVLDFNTRINIFPQTIIASIFRFKPKEFFEAKDAQSKINISFSK